MILFSEEWERVAGYRFPQQSVTPLVARSLDGHTAHFTNHTAQQHRATAHTNATLFTLLDYTLPSSLAMLCHNICDTLWEQSDYNIIFNHCSPVHTGQWPHSTFPQMATLEHSSTQFWLPRFLSRNFQSESQTQSLIQFTVCLASSNKPQKNWNMISFIYMYLVPAHHIRGLHQRWHQRCQQTHLYYCICVFAILPSVSLPFGTLAYFCFTSSILCADHNLRLCCWWQFWQKSIFYLGSTRLVGGVRSMCLLESESPEVSFVRLCPVSY